jgi:acetolactate synthase-1/2/3 large subunit
MWKTSVRQASSEKVGQSMETISGGHLVAKALKAEGVEAIFTLCGGHIIDIYDGCLDGGGQQAA